jgi:hypothetical protein
VKEAWKPVVKSSTLLKYKAGRRSWGHRFAPGAAATTESSQMPPDCYNYISCASCEPHDLSTRRPVGSIFIVHCRFLRMVSLINGCQPQSSFRSPCAQNSPTISHEPLYGARCCAPDLVCQIFRFEPLSFEDVRRRGEDVVGRARSPMYLHMKCPKSALGNLWGSYWLDKVVCNSWTLSECML